MIIAINYANAQFRLKQKYNTLTAYKKGKVDKVIEYSPDDIDDDFKKENQEILAFERGDGLWIWKPYFILKTLQKMSKDDYLIYVDSGAYYCNNVRYLIKTIEDEGKDILAFQIPLLEIQWTKKETFDYMGVKDYSRNQFLGGYMVLKKTEFTISLVKEWLELMKNPICSSPIDTSKERFETFIEHREDQSVFSLLCHKYGIEGHREPNQYGDYPWLYRYNRKFAYRSIDFINSPYPRILVSVRKDNPWSVKWKLIMKDLLSKFKLYKPLFDKDY